MPTTSPNLPDATLRAWATDFLRYLEAQRAASPLTIKSYDQNLQAAAIFFQNLGENLHWKNLRSEHVRLWVAQQMENKRAPASINRSLSALRSFYKFLLRENRITTDPTQLIRNPKQGKRLPTFVKENEMDKLFAHYPFADNYEGQRDRTVLLLLYHTGLRAAELLGLRIADVQLTQRQLIVTGKGNKQRIVPFGEELAHALSLFIEQRKAHFEKVDTTQNLLFLHPKGRAMSYAALRKLVRTTLAAVTTQQKKSPHVLRHSFATAMLAHGAQLEAIKQLLGHESVSTTAIYTHTTIAELQAQYQQAHPHAQPSNNTDNKS